MLPGANPPMTTPTLPRRITVTSEPKELDLDALKKMIEKQEKPPADPLDNLEKKFKERGQVMNREVKKSIVEEIPLELPPVEVTPNAKSFNPRINNSVSRDLGPHVERITLPSNSLFYNFSDLSIRPFEVPDFAKIAKANKKKLNSMLVDVIGDTISEDVRDLAYRDYRFIMYWQKINSFTRNPYKLNWTSFYGNVNSVTINKSTLKITELESTREEYESWLERGFCMPTVRDLEEFEACKADLDEEELFYWPRAKYLIGESVKDKLAKAKSLTPDEFFVDTQEFSDIFERYGVVEYIDTVDAHFKAEEALKKLNEYVITSELALTSKAIADSDINEEIMTRISKYKVEIARIQNSISNTGEAAPSRETIEFSIEPTDFFSVVRN